MTDASTSPAADIALIGFGEAGQAFAAGWRTEGAGRITAWDVKSACARTAAAKQADYAAAGVTGAESLAQALAGAKLIFSLVTADQARAAATSAAQHIAPGALFLDCNSCAPSTKQGSDSIIRTGGGRYVDVAVMAPVHPRLHKTPVLVSGLHAAEAAAALEKLGMDVRVAGDKVGDASAIKMIRSVMFKGLEALTLECILSAVKAGVDEEVVASLDASFPGFDWKTRSAYMLERVATHGVRRAAEMREAALTVDDLGLSGHMSRATALRQDQIGRLGVRADDTEDYAALARRLLDALAQQETNGPHVAAREQGMSGPHPKQNEYDDIPGTIVFDAQRARKGYHLNQFLYSLMSADNRKEFLADERKYLDKFPMTEDQKVAVMGRAWNTMLDLGGVSYALAKLAFTDQHSYQYMAAEMCNLTQDEYVNMMLAGGRSPEGWRYKHEREGKN